MSTLKRRQFLQFGGAALAALGLHHFDAFSHRYGQVLAQPTRRKRALLVGIGDYPGSSSEDLNIQGLWYRLRGAVNDVLLQKELLMHRFGFAPEDIVLLTDQDATRANILEQMQTLIQWVQSSDDVVVFHYSGHGSNVIDPNKIFPDQLNGTIVPIDADLPLGYPQEGGDVNDITAGTIFLLREALARRTKNVTFILDSCYSGGGIRGNLTFRSRPGQAEVDRRGGVGSELVLSPAELDEQQRWLAQLNWSEADWIERRRQGQIAGAAFVAASRAQQAADVAIAQDFHAGVFTYALTRHLWQQTADQGMGKVVVATGGKTDQFLKSLDPSKSQTPGLEVMDRSQPMFFTPMINPAAEAVVTKIKGKSVELLLTGLEPEILEAFGRGAVFTVVDAAGQPQGTVAVESRDRISAQGIFTPQNDFALKPGATLQEQLRSVPADLNLRIGIDPSLDAEQAAVKQALSIIPRIEVVPLLEQDVHYIVGRIVGQEQLGLFTVGLELLPGTERSLRNGVSVAIATLQTKLKVLLAARVVKLTLNTNSSQLNVAAKLKIADNQELLAQSFTVRGQNTEGVNVVEPAASLAHIPIGKPVQISIENRDSRDLHIALLIFSPDGDIDVLFPFSDGQNAALVRQGTTLNLPNSVQIQRGAALKFQPPLGSAELLILASTTPIQKALVPIQVLAAERRQEERSQTQVGQKAKDAILGLLDDLASETRSGSRPDDVTRVFNPRQMAALSIPFAIVEETA